MSDGDTNPIAWVREQIEHSPLRYDAEILDHIDALERWVREDELNYGEVPLDNFKPDPETPLELGAWDLGVIMGYHLAHFENGYSGRSTEKKSLKADSRGRVNLGTDYAGRGVRVAILDADDAG